ncbi:MAG: FAD synthetase family protein [Treponema sp.]|nr:FAD synthetase family protein [Treponema sp.]
MLVIDWQDFLENGLPLNGRLSSMTVGIFDGVHLGHQELLKCVTSHSFDKYAPVVVTFRQNHKTLEQTGIQSFEQRLEQFEKLGIQITIVIDFTEEFRLMPGIKFLEILLKHGSVGFIAIGSDFRCGRQLDTDAKMIHGFFASCGIPAEIVPEVTEGSLPISSSRIRTAIAAGDFSLAEKMLGRAYLPG